MRTPVSEDSRRSVRLSLDYPVVALNFDSSSDSDSIENLSSLSSMEDGPGDQPENDFLPQIKFPLLLQTLNHKLSQQAFPILGAGIYSYPLDQAFLIGIQSVLVFFEVHPANTIDTVSFVVFNDQGMFSRCHALMLRNTSIDLSHPSAVLTDILGAYWPGGSTETSELVFQGSEIAVKIATFYNQPAPFHNMLQSSSVPTSQFGCNSVGVRGQEDQEVQRETIFRSPFSVQTTDASYKNTADNVRIGLKRPMRNESLAESELNLTPTKLKMKASTSSEEKKAKNAAYQREYRARKKEQSTGLSQTLADSAIDEICTSDNESISSRGSSVSRQYKMSDAKREEARLKKRNQRSAAANTHTEEITEDGSPSVQVPNSLRGSRASTLTTQSDRQRNAERHRDHRARIANIVMRNTTQDQSSLDESSTAVNRMVSTRDRSFLDVIVQMNSLLAMASNVYTKEPVGPFGVQATKVLGTVNHFPSALRVNPGGQEGFGNFYCYDAEEATKRRMDSSWSEGIDEELLKELTRVLHRTHPLAQSYKMMHEVLKREERQGRDPGRMKMRIVTAHEAQDMDVNLLQHEGTYSVPVGKDFVCVFFSCSPSQVVLPRGLTVYKSRGNHNSYEIKFYTKVVDALCYPLMFPYGEGLWEACRLPMESIPRRYETRMEEIRNSGTGEEQPSNNPNREPTRYDYEDDIAIDVGNEMEDVIAELAAGEAEQPGTQRGIRIVERGGEMYPERVDASEVIPLNEGYMTDDSGPDQDFEDDMIDQLVQQQLGTVPNEGEMINFDETDFLPEFDDEMIEQLVQLRNATEQDDEYGGTLTHLEEILDQQDEDRLQTFGDELIRSVDYEDNDYEEDEDIHHGETVPVPKTNELVEREEQMEYIDGEEQPESDDFVETRQPSRRRGFISIREAALFFNRYPKEGKSRIAHFRKLGQLYLIDVDTRIIHQRMQHIQKNFTQTLNSTKKQLVTCLQNNIDRNDYKVTVGSVTTVPAHVPGSPRYMRQKFEEAVALANTHGHPDIFLTFTGNRDWPEIKNAIPHGDTFADHPMIVAEVFFKKMNAFLEDVLGRKDTNSTSRRTPGLFGEVAWFVYSVEFQARGMPHIHLIVSLRTHIRTTSDIDRIVWARIPELPDAADPNYSKMVDLRNLVMKHMTHRPCEGDDTAYCNQDKPRHWKTCMKRFPKQFNQETEFGDKSYPDYYRPDDKQSCRIKMTNGQWTDCNNTYVVPYNPTLLMKYRSHINVEVISSIKVVKYLFKYIFKGYDRTIIEAFERFGSAGPHTGTTGKMTQSGHILHRDGLTSDQIAERNQMAKWLLQDRGVPLTHTDPVTGDVTQTLVYDETAFIEDMRAITSCEAAWDIGAYPRCVSSHSVVTLYVHSPEEEPVRYVPGEEEEVLDRIERNDVMSRLKAWFELNTKTTPAGDKSRTLTFDELPKYFTYSGKKWAMRRNDWSNRMHGRIKSVQPRYMEQFAIRLLSMNQRGPTSFADLRTVEGVVHPTFVEAAKAMRLMNDEHEWDFALREAGSYESPTNMRRLFISILVFCAPTNPLALWNEHKKDMFINNNWTEPAKVAHALHHIQSGLKAHDMSLEQFGLPAIIDADLRNISPGNLLDDNDGFDLGVNVNAQRADQMYQLMNVDQKRAIHAICPNGTPVDSTRSRCFFLDGAGGTGKTFVYKYLYHRFSSQGRKVLCVAHTGIAANLLPNGSTAHRAFGLPIKIDDNIASHLDVSGYKAKDLAAVDVIVWDEASMSDRRIYEAVDNFLRIIKGNQLFMGGILTVFGGDWRQTLPILEDMPESAIPTYTLKNTDLWKSTVKLRLTINQRAHLDPTFCDFLVKVGNGSANDERGQVELPLQIMKATEESVVDWLYPREDMENYDEMSQKTLLTVDNRTALELNEKILGRMSGLQKTYLSMDKTDAQKGFVSIDPEIYKSMTPSGMPPHKLVLKKNCQVILLRNQSVKLGLCNGTRMRVLQLGEDTILCAPVNPGPFTPEKVVIHRMDLTPARAPTKDFAFIRHQFPLRLAFAMTVNKSQGQTLNKVGLLLRTSCFSHGQLYVALSRVRSKDDIRVYNSKKDSLGRSNMVTNRVLKSVLN